MGDEAECEQAAQFIAAAKGLVVGRGGALQHGGWSHLPKGCSLYTDSVKGDWSVYYNTRQVIYHYQQLHWSPVCHHKDNTKNKRRLTGFRFRNPPGFMPNIGSLENVPGDDNRRLNPYGDDDHLQTFAQYETDALIDHLHEHENTPPFVAYRIIQRMVSSNPSPRYVEAVSTAFATGLYSGKNYSGEYGDMAAAIAAVLLDPEARSTLLEADPSHGSIREPLMKLLHVLRSMSFVPQHGRELQLQDLHLKIGQMAYSSPSVFNFYLPEFIPAGVLGDAGLVSPESQLSTAPNMIGYLNGMASLIDYGLSQCASGFGENNNPIGRDIKGVAGSCSVDHKDKWRKLSDGVLSFKPSYPANPTSVIDEMAVLLTAGRLSTQTRSVLIAAYAHLLAEKKLNISALVVAAAKTRTRVAVQGCHVIKNKTQCCEYTDGRPQYAEAPNCIPGTFGASTVCVSERWANNDHGANMETCGREPLATMKAAHYWARGGMDGKYGEVPWRQSWADGGCVYARNVDDPWWQVDLAAKVDIKSIIIHNRRDCCGSANSNLKIYVDNNQCASSGTLRTNDKIRFPCQRNAGQVIRVMRPGKVGGTFTICEVTVMVNQDPNKDGIFPRNTENEARALKHVQKLFTMSPEFHTTNRHESSPVVRPRPTLKPTQNRKYKAIVVLFLSGGADSYSMLVPNKGCKKPPSAEDDPTLAPRRLTGGVSCAATPSCVPVSTSVWCKTHADTLGVAYKDSYKIHSSTFQPAGCFYRSDTAALEFNDVKTSAYTHSAFEPICLCGAYQAVGVGYCRQGYYAGNPTPGATFDQCRGLCDVEDRCRFFSWGVDTCRRYTGDLDTCLEGQGLLGDTHRTFQKLKTARRARAASTPARDKRDVSANKKDWVDHNYYEEYKEIRGEEFALKQQDLLELKMPTDHTQPCDTFGLHHKLPILKKLYDEGDLSMVANMGALTEPISMKDYKEKHLGLKKFPPGLFAHNSMQNNAWTVHADCNEASQQQYLFVLGLLLLT